MAGIGIRIQFIWVMYSCLAGVVASSAQWRFGIFAVGLQMAIRLNQVKSRLISNGIVLRLAFEFSGFHGYRAVFFARSAADTAC